MRVNRFPRIVVAAVMAGGLALTGCSKGEEKADPEEMGPLQEYLQPLWEGEEWTADRAKQEHTVREEIIAKCMNDEGWDYKPQPWDDSGFQMVSDDESEDAGPAWGTLEFAKQYGYGAISWPGQNEATEEATAEPEQEYVDVNQEYVSSLSESEQTSYYEALYGKHQEYQELDEDGNEVQPTWDPSTEGCSGKAYLEQQGDDPWQDPDFEELMQRMQTEVWDLSGENNDEVAKLDREWSTCMSGKGYSFASRSEASQHIYDQVNALWDFDWEANPEGPDQTEIDKKQEEIRVEEIKQATEDFTCADEVNYDEVVKKIQFAAEEKFVQENKAQLDAMIAKYKDRNKGK